MHPAKTKYNIIQTRQKSANSAKQSLDLSVDGMQLTKVESERVLGVYIDSHLTWNEHIDTLRRKLLQRIAILARARKYIPTKYRLLLYNASIKPLFTYCCTVWSNCSQTNLDELFNNWIVVGMHDRMINFKSLSGYRLINYSSSIKSAF